MRTVEKATWLQGDQARNDEAEPDPHEGLLGATALILGDVGNQLVFKQRVKQVLSWAGKGKAYLGRLGLEVSTEFRQGTVVAYTKAGASGRTLGAELVAGS